MVLEYSEHMSDMSDFHKEIEEYAMTLKEEKICEETEETANSSLAA